MPAEKPSVTTESSDIVTSTITSVVLLFDCLKRTFLTVAVTYFSQRDTECYAAEMEQLLPFGDMTVTKDQLGTFSTTDLSFGKVALMF